MMTFDDRSAGAGTSTGEYVPVRRDTGTFEVLPVTAVPVPAPDPAPAQVRPNLHYVFDDPNEGEPGRDRMLVHGLWELILAIALGVGGYVLTQARPGALGGHLLQELALTAAVLALLAAASALALRVGAPNLAVGAAAVFGIVWVGEHAEGGWAGPTAVALAICAAVGLIQGLVVVGLHVPSWAVSLAVALGAMVWAGSRGPIRLDIDYDPFPDAYVWFFGVAALSVVACLIAVVSRIRRAVGRFRPVADPARRRGIAAAVITAAATVVSMVLAGLAGVLMILMTTEHGDSLLTSDAESSVLLLTAFGLGGALLGGTSAFGRRGGIFGTVFAACLLAATLAYVAEEHATVPRLAVAAVAIALGLAVTRLVERFGRPILLAPVDESEEDWMPRVHAIAPPAKPWQPAPTPTGGLWSADDGWGTPR
jgi:ribose/xylose/arabinose/galactoside ABC-type transport system permease subunit